MVKRFIFLILMITGFQPVLFPYIPGHQDWQKLPMRCASCHIGHGISGTAMLPKNEEEFCFQCHGDHSEVETAIRKNLLLTGTRKNNLRMVFSKQYRHPVELRNPVSDFFLNEKQDLFGPTRAECLDCHRGHGVSTAEISPGSAPKRSTKKEGEFEYQLCYSCHGRIIRISQAKKDIRSLFNPSNPSFHPIETTGRNPDVPSLKKPYSESSVINCSDCHNNNDPAGPKGPHGSEYHFILERNYILDDFFPENHQQYDLCYKCHERDSILGDESFPMHRKHIVQQTTSCFTCHNSHGSQRNSHLIKFNEGNDPLLIKKSSSGKLEFNDRGILSGECFLSCHGVDHNPKRYSRF